MIPGSEPEVIAPPAAPPRTTIDFRLIAAILLLAVAVVFTALTVEGLAARRVLRAQLAEIGHVRYDLLSADRWAAILTPILDAKVDAINFEPTKDANLRPMVQNALYRLLDDIKTQMSAPKPAAAASGAPNSSAPNSAAPNPTSPKPAGSGGFGGFLGQGNTFVVNMVVGAIRPHVPEYTDVVLKELARPESKRALNDALKKYIRTALNDAVRNTFGHVDTTGYSAILSEHACADGAACKQRLGELIREWDATIFRRYIPVLVATALAFLLLLVGRTVLRPSAAVVLLLFCAVLLAGGLLTPMLEVEAKITQLRMTFLGAPITFNDQVLYFQSKSVLEVFRALINTDRPDMWIVGVLVLTFSVIFPSLKILASLIYLYVPGTLRRNRLVRFFALESSKWSMADVMALAIFMAFVAFNGLIGNTMGILLNAGADLTIPTDSSKILPGYFLFIGFCLASLFLSRKLAHRHE
jgi:hypothetical protein